MIDERQHPTPSTRTIAWRPKHTKKENMRRHVPWREECVEATDEVRSALEQGGDTADDPRRVDALRLELLHDVQELIVHPRLILWFGI